MMVTANPSKDATISIVINLVKGNHKASAANNFTSPPAIIPKLKNMAKTAFTRSVRHGKVKNFY